MSELPICDFRLDDKCGVCYECKIEQLKKERDTLLNILKDFSSTTECKRTWVDEMQGTIDAVLEEMGEK